MLSLGDRLRNTRERVMDDCDEHDAGAPGDHPLPALPPGELEPVVPAEGEEARPGWAVVELFGHRQRLGWVRPGRAFGADQVVVRVLRRDGTLAAPEFYAPRALYSYCPMTAQDIAAATGVDPRQLTLLEDAEPAVMVADPRRAQEASADIGEPFGEAFAEVAAVLGAEMADGMYGRRNLDED